MPKKTSNTKKTSKKNPKNNSKYQSQPQKNEVELSKQAIDRITRQRTFEPLGKPTVGAEFFIFKQRGDEIEGELISGPIVNINRSSSYAIRLDDGRVIEFFGNRLLHKIIRQNELLFSRVRIVYIGWQHTNYGGHKRKIYRVYKDKGFIRKDEERIA